MLEGDSAVLSQVITPEYVENGDVFILEIGQRWGTMTGPRDYNYRYYVGATGGIEKKQIPLNPSGLRYGPLQGQGNNKWYFYNIGFQWPFLITV